MALMEEPTKIYIMVTMARLTAIQTRMNRIGIGPIRSIQNLVRQNLFVNQNKRNRPKLLYLYPSQKQL